MHHSRISQIGQMYIYMCILTWWSDIGLSQNNSTTTIISFTVNTRDNETPHNKAWHGASNCLSSIFLYIIYIHSEFKANCITKISHQMGGLRGLVITNNLKRKLSGTIFISVAPAAPAPCTIILSVTDTVPLTPSQWHSVSVWLCCNPP
jgi:hypothetical protein